MNPDFNYNETTASTTWTLKHPDGHVATFKVVKNGNVIITYNQRSFGCIVEKARKYWGEYINRGFFVFNKCVDHNMKKFHNTYREMEKIDYDELQEARINPKEFYKINYALEA
jgi:hypothetical protein